MKINRKNAAGQVVQPPAPPPPAAEPAPEDVAEITDRYTKLVGRVVQSMERLENFGSREINAIAALGRSLATLVAIDQASGDDGLRKLKNEELRRQLLGNNPETVEFEEVGDEE